MKIFMRNVCGYGNCMDSECEKCPHFKPYFLSLPVTRKLGSLLYSFETRLWAKNYNKTF